MDKRILKSTNKLKESFIELMKIKSPVQITVKELCEHAGLNRSTFYERFGYMDALIENIIDDCVEYICLGNPTIYELPYEDSGISRESIREYIDRFLENKILMVFCLTKNNDTYQSMIIQAQIRISMRENENLVKYYPAFLQNSGVLYMLIDWIKNDMPIPKETVVEIIHQFSKAMFYEYSLSGEKRKKLPQIQ